MDRFAPHIDLRIVIQNNFTIRTLFNKSLKRKIDKLQRFRVIYMIRCRDCSANYIGKTKRKLVTRVCEHRAALKGKAFRALLSMTLLLAMWWTGIMSPLFERLRQIYSLYTKRPF